VTLGRVRGEEGVEQLAAALNRQSKWQGGATEVRELLVLSSELTPRGPQYTILGRAKLRRAGRQPLKSSQDEEE
jgi:2'-5' RNA ligase